MKNNNAIEQKTTGRYSIYIEQDDLDMNPRHDDNFCTMLHVSRDYDLGDKKATREEIEEIESNKKYFSLPFYAYIHSGVTISLSSFSCRFDSGQAGIIYLDKEKFLREWQLKDWDQDAKTQAIKLMQSEVETFDKYLTGQVYYYKILDDKTGEVVDSCGGFYDEPEEIIKEYFDSRVDEFKNRAQLHAAMIEVCKENFINGLGIDELQKIAAEGFTAFDEREFSDLESYIKENNLQNKLDQKMQQEKGGAHA